MQVQNTLTLHSFLSKDRKWQKLMQLVDVNRLSLKYG